CDDQIHIKVWKVALEILALANGDSTPGVSLLFENGVPDRMKLRTTMSLKSRDNCSIRDTICPQPPC
ncbi:hypothetical protein ACO1MM_14130, partial [Staphylococcus aureus]